MAEVLARPGTESSNQGDARRRLQDAVRFREDIDESVRLHVLRAKSEELSAKRRAKSQELRTLDCSPVHREQHQTLSPWLLAFLSRHRHNRGVGFDPVPKVLYTQVLVFRVLVVVVIRDWNCHRNCLQIVSNDRQW